MRAMLLLFAILAGAAAAYLAGDRGATDALVILTAAAAVFALVMFKLVPAGSPNRRKGWAPAPVHSSAVRDEAAELAGTVEALVAARGAESQGAGSEQSTVTVFLRSVGPNQIAVIKVVREYLRLGLREAKALTDAANRGEQPMLHRAMPSAIARKFRKDIEDAGGELEVR